MDERKAPLSGLETKSTIPSASRLGQQKRSHVKLLHRLRHDAGMAGGRQPAVSVADCFLEDEGCAAVVEELLQDQHRLVQSVDLRGNDLRAPAAAHISRLMQLHGSISSVILCWNSLGSPEALQLLFSALNQSSVTELDLQNNQIDSAGAEIIASCVATNMKLKKLDLRWNAIQPAGAAALLRACQTNTVLEELQLTGNQVSFAVIEEIETSLNRNRKSAAEDSHHHRARWAAEQELLDEAQVEEEHLQKELKDALLGSEEKVKALDLELSANQRKLEEMQDQYTNELQEHQDENKRAQKTVETLEREKRELYDELGALRKSHNDTEQAFEQLQREHEDLLQRFERVSSERGQLAHTLQTKDDIHNKATQHLHDEVERLTTELSRAQNSALEMQTKLQESLEQERLTYSKEMAAARDLELERSKEHARELEEVRRSFQTTVSTLEAQVQDSRRKREAAEDAALEARKQLVQARLQRQEQLTALETSMAEMHRKDMNQKLSAMEERLEMVVSARAQLVKRMQQQEQEYDRLSELKTQELQNQQSRWQQERHALEEQLRELHHAKAKCASLEAALKQRDNANALLESNTKQLRAQFDTFAQQQDERTQQLLQDHAEETAEIRKRLDARDTTVGQLRHELQQAQQDNRRLRARFAAAASSLQGWLSQLQQDAS